MVRQKGAGKGGKRGVSAIFRADMRKCCLGPNLQRWLSAIRGRGQAGNEAAPAGRMMPLQGDHAITDQPGRRPLDDRIGAMPFPGTIDKVPDTGNADAAEGMGGRGGDHFAAMGSGVAETDDGQWHAWLSLRRGHDQNAPGRVRSVGRTLSHRWMASASLRLGERMGGYSCSLGASGSGSGLRVPIFISTSIKGLLMPSPPRDSS